MSTTGMPTGSSRPRRRRRQLAGPQNQQLPHQQPPLMEVVLPQPAQRGRRRRLPQGGVRTPRRGRGRGNIPRTAKQTRQPGLWWLMGQFQVGATSPPGSIELLVLHPSNFPNTPYSAACMHHTHRMERRWDLKIEVTTATTTGARVAVFALPDPDWNPRTISQEMVWGSCLNGMGTLATVTGTGQTVSQFTLRTATNRLSNAHPDGRNYLGYAAAVLVVYLLEPPIALTGTVGLKVSVLARVDLEVYNPIPGFLAFTADVNPGPGPGPQPTTSAWALTIPQSKVATAVETIWYNSHTASAWLAGGIYMRFPATKPTDSTKVNITGVPKSFAVYTASTQAENWHDNSGNIKTPKYFTTWYEPGSAVCQIVGFETFENAANQARGETGLVPHGAECCLIYSGTPKAWSDYWEIPSNAASTINFVEVMTTPSSKPVYAAAVAEVAGEVRGPHQNLPSWWGPPPPGGNELMTLQPSASAPTQRCQTSFDPFVVSSGPECLVFGADSTRLSTSSTASLHLGYGPRPPPSPPPLEDDRCDALTEASIASIASQLEEIRARLQAVEMYAEPSGESFEIVRSCSGCDDPDCDFCFEDDDGTPVD